MAVQAEMSAGLRACRVCPRYCGLVFLAVVPVCMAQAQCQPPAACNYASPAADRQEAPTSSPAPTQTLPGTLPPSAPVIINGCDAGGCNDVNANRYNGNANGNEGNGNGLYLDKSGRRCIRSGAWLQCS
jgi:hypothetical protein